MTTINNSDYELINFTDHNNRIKSHSTTVLHFTTDDDLDDIATYDTPDHTIAGLCQVGVKFDKNPPELYARQRMIKPTIFKCKLIGNTFVFSNK